MKFALALAAGLLVGCGPASAKPQGELPDALVPRPEGRATRELENLAAFARLHGYVRFFHPTDAATDADWQHLAAAGVAHVRDAESLGELTDKLDEIYEPLAPSLQLWTVDEPTPVAPRSPKRRGEMVYWQYQGFPGTPISLYRPPYRRVRVGPDEDTYRTFTEAPPPDATVDEELVADLRVRMPVALDRMRARQAEGADDLDIEPSALDVRQGAVIEVWNVLRHFYPYPEAVEGDWDALLLGALDDAADDQTDADTVATLDRLLHRIHDGHAEAGHENLPRRATLPLRLELVDGRAVVTGTSQPNLFKVGDVVERIGDTPVLEAVAAAEAQLSGSPQWRRFKATTMVVPSGRSGDTTSVSTGRGTVEAKFVRSAPPRAHRLPPIHRFADGVFYVDLTRSDWSEIDAEMESIAAAPGVVFDLRGYPNDTHRVLEHLLSEPEDALWMHVPRYVEPGGKPIGYKHIGWHLRPAEPQIQGKVSFLVSAEAISYAESVLAYVEAHDLATIIGSTPSAGTNGDIVRFDAVGDFFVIFTGMRVTRHDGRPFHLQGVAPDVVVEPTIAALRRGHDPQLRAARDFVAQSKLAKR